MLQLVHLNHTSVQRFYKTLDPSRVGEILEEISLLILLFIEPWSSSYSHAVSSSFQNGLVFNRGWRYFGLCLHSMEHSFPADHILTTSLNRWYPSRCFWDFLLSISSPVSG